MNSGWIKLHRELLDKAIWSCSTPEQKVVLITLLLNVNYESRQWEWKGQKYECRPGQLITSIDSLAYLCGCNISSKNVRTALKKFEKYGFLAIETASTGTLITIENWEDFQSENMNGANEQESEWQAGGKRVANDGQTDGKRVATTKEIKNNKKDKNNKNNKNNIYNAPNFDQVWSTYPRKIEKAAAYKAYCARLVDGYSEDELLKATQAYAEECKQKNREQQYIKQGKTFFGPNTPFVDYLKKEEDLEDGKCEERKPASDFYRQYLTGSYDHGYKRSADTNNQRNAD